MAKKYGWYSQRRAIQMWFVTGLAMAGVTLIGIIGWIVRGLSRQRWLAFYGIVLLTAFIIVRAASIHHVFEMLKLKLPESWLLGILQWSGISGIICIGLSAFVGIINHRKRSIHRR